MSFWSAAQGNNDSLPKQQREKELKHIGMIIREAILQRDTITFMKYASRDGIPCVDDVVPYRKVKKDLENPNSWLYCYLFSSKDFERKYKDEFYPMGLDRFFREAPNFQIKVSFMDIDGKEDYDYGCIHFVTPTIDYSPELCFFFKNEKWTFTDSPYSCL